MKSKIWKAIKIICETNRFYYNYAIIPSSPNSPNYAFGTGSGYFYTNSINNKFDLKAMNNLKKAIASSFNQKNTDNLHITENHVYLGSIQELKQTKKEKIILKEKVDLLYLDFQKIVDIETIDDKKVATSIVDCFTELFEAETELENKKIICDYGEKIDAITNNLSVPIINFILNNCDSI